MTRTARAASQSVTRAFDHSVRETLVSSGPGPPTLSSASGPKPAAWPADTKALAAPLYAAPRRRSWPRRFARPGRVSRRTASVPSYGQWQHARLLNADT
jgi:hypothetical protein